MVDFKRCIFFAAFYLSIIIYFASCSTTTTIAFNSEPDQELNESNRNSVWSEPVSDPNAPKKISKRLETIDGVEIASSYKEYLDLALDDLEDRLKKSGIKLTDLKERIKKRSELLSEIDKEIIKRKEFSLQLSEKDKILRTRLLRNTEMKSALQNLADIAGYKLYSLTKEQFYPDLHEKSNMNVQIEENKTSSVDNLNYNVLASQFKNHKPMNIRVNNHNNSNNKAFISNDGTYTRYIEMAYAEVESILTKDKQTLIEVIRNLKTNEMKLKELEQLKVKVNSSLSRLKDFHFNLITIINRDKQIETTVQQLETQIKMNDESNGYNNYNSNTNNFVKVENNLKNNENNSKLKRSLSSEKNEISNDDLE